MITFKCKMCGGDLHPEENATTCECEYCGSVQTIPTADNEKKGNLFNRANRLRMAAEYDKAASVYTSITAEFPEEAEAYWGLCLCKYGIEYVEDPVTAKKIPTCHRTRSESIMDDPDFDQACENADAVAKRVYREEAKAIDRLQQDILSVVANESPYDVFICYKETDDDGQRTEDSVLAQDVYDALTAKGLKVFFARITLEDKLGQQYEPYIYAALHSAKVMLAIGTQFEFFDAVWVKNEWSRFLDMMKSDKSKTLIPCYKDIDAYDMPREFKNLQGQDMGKLGWLQDLTRGVVKLCGKDEEKGRTAPVIQKIIDSGRPTEESLIKRAYVFLEDMNWSSAIEYAEKVLDINVSNVDAYLIKLLADHKVTKVEELQSINTSLDENDNYHKILRFDSSDLKNRLIDYNVEIIQRIVTEKEQIAKEKTEMDALQQINSALAEYKDLESKYTDYTESLNNLKGLFVSGERKTLKGYINTTKEKMEVLERKIKSLCEMISSVAINPSEILKDKREIWYTFGKKHLSHESEEEAAKWLVPIREYKDVSTIISSNPKLYDIYLHTVGSIIQFGTYCQDGDASIKDPIDWIVIDCNRDLIKLISKNVLTAKPYHRKSAEKAWGSCSLRTWLNEEFLTDAFSTREKKMIQPIGSMVKQTGDSQFDVYSKDYVSLLSTEEATAYFQNDESRIAYPTAKAQREGVVPSKRTGTCWWWLRSSGVVLYRATVIDENGLIDNIGNDVNSKKGGVRPVIVIKN